MSDLYYLGSSKWRPSREFLLTQSLKPPDPGSEVFGRLMRPVACGPGGLRMAASRTAGGVRDFDGIYRSDVRGPDAADEAGKRVVRSERVGGRTAHAINEHAIIPNCGNVDSIFANVCA